MQHCSEEDQWCQRTKAVDNWCVACAAAYIIDEARASEWDKCLRACICIRDGYSQYNTIQHNTHKNIWTRAWSAEALPSRLLIRWGGLQVLVTITFTFWHSWSRLLHKLYEFVVKSYSQSSRVICALSIS